jgi:hypothetical protein
MQQLGAAACLVYVCLVCAGLVTVFFYMGLVTVDMEGKL